MEIMEWHSSNEGQTPVHGALYEPPLVEILEVEIEKGFRSSIEGFEEGEEQDW